MKLRDKLQLQGASVLDGGMASELERMGADISGPLWSAHVLEDAPEKVMAVHRAYLDAGADVLLTASYQVSRRGYLEFGFSSERADRALLRSVELARVASFEGRAELAGDSANTRPILIAASLGPYGASLHNGAEYHGNYECPYLDLVRFHRERIVVLADSGADLLAFETLPSFEEARAIGEALEPWPDLAAWFTFNCPDQNAAKSEVAHGELLRECIALVDRFPQTVAAGINCTDPVWISSLICEVKKATAKPIVVYPNSGDGWDSTTRCWTGSGEATGFGDQAAAWFAAGAQLVGGCCRTGPEHIRQVAAAAQRIDRNHVIS